MTPLKVAVLALCVAVVGCGTLAPKEVVKTVTVDIPVGVPCDVEVGPRPDYPVSKEALAGLSTVEKVRLLLVELILRQNRERVLEAAIEGCRAQKNHQI